MKLNVPKRVVLPNGKTFIALINESLEQNCLLILSCVELIGKELRQEVAEYLILLKKSGQKPINLLTSKKRD